MSNYLNVEIRSEFALVRLCREPANVMDLGFWQALAATLEELEADPATRGVVFISDLKRDIFTAGNDVSELYAPLTSAERYRWVRRAAVSVLLLISSPRSQQGP